MNEQIKAGADIHAGDGGYSIGTQEKYEEFARARRMKYESHLPVTEQSLVFRLRKSVQEEANDGIADLLEESANEIERLIGQLAIAELTILDLTEDINNLKK